MQSPTKTVQGYQANPFSITISGLDALFKQARSVAILFIVISIIRTFTQQTEKYKPDGSQASNPMVQPDISLMALLVVMILMALFVGISILINGISDYTSAQLSQGKKTTLRQATRAVLASFWSYAWLRILVTIKIIAWSLVFVIPGIVMAFRYSLAGVSYYDKGLRGNEAITHSSKLVKGGWLTTFASHALLNVVTLGFMVALLEPGTNAVLYRQFTKLKQDHPSAHWLSWATLVIAILLAFALVAAIIVLLPYIILAIASSAR